MGSSFAPVAVLLVLVRLVPAEPLVSLGYEDCWTGDDLAASGLPWYASIFVKNEQLPGVFQFLLPGVLVTDRHVLTDTSRLAGEWPDFDKKDPNDLYVLLGANSSRWDVDLPGVVVNRVSRASAMNDYTSDHCCQSNGLAIVELDVPIAFTDKVRPACIDSSVHQQIGDPAMLAFHDGSENQMVDLIQTNFIDQEEECGDLNLYSNGAEKKFCANVSKKVECGAACGSPLFARAADGRWLLKGVFTDYCYSNRHIIYNIDGLLPDIHSAITTTCFTGRASPPPWNGLLYQRTPEGGDYRYFCAATLITDVYLLSDGSCFIDKVDNSSGEVSGIFVSLGKKLKTLAVEETDSVMLEVSNVVLEDGGRGMALLQLEAPAGLGLSIGTLCLDTTPAKPLSVGTPGVVPAFDLQDNSTLKTLFVKVVSSEKCVSDRPEFQSLLTDNKFCAIDIKAGLCPGNEGVGLATRSRSPGARWLLKGIAMKRPPPPAGDDACPRGDALYSTVNNSMPWILSTLHRLSVPPASVKPEGVKGCWSGRAGDVPWHVLIYQQLERPDWLDLKCTGTLVTRWHVVSDAACFWDEASNGVGDVKRMQVAAGKKIRDWNTEDKTAQYKKISKVLVHPSYKHHEAGGVANMAVVLLESMVNLGGNVQAICVDINGDSPLADGQAGLVPVLATERSSKLKVLNVKLLNEGECSAQLPPNTTWNIGNDKFCAADRKVPEAFCEGNVGAGLVVRGPGGAFLLKGVASAWQVRFRGHFCSRDAVFFTAVDGYRQWLLDTLQEMAG